MDRGISRRWYAAMLVATALVLVMVQLLGTGRTALLHSTEADRLEDSQKAVKEDWDGSAAGERVEKDASDVEGQRSVGEWEASVTLESREKAEEEARARGILSESSGSLEEERDWTEVEAVDEEEAGAKEQTARREEVAEESYASEKGREEGEGEGVTEEEEATTTSSRMPETEEATRPAVTPAGLPPFGVGSAVGEQQDVHARDRRAEIEELRRQFLAEVAERNNGAFPPTATALSPQDTEALSPSSWPDYELLAPLGSEETLRAYADIVGEYYAKVLPIMTLEQGLSDAEYREFSESFSANRKRMVELREKGGWGEVRMAFVTSGNQLAKMHSGEKMERSDLRESIIIDNATLRRQLELSLASNFLAAKNGSSEYEKLAESFCTEENFFCLGKPWLEMGASMGVDYAILWPQNHWAHDYERLGEYDYLVILDQNAQERRATQRKIQASPFSGRVLRMPSEAVVMKTAMKMSEIVRQGGCHVVLDNYWLGSSVWQNGHILYPLWFRYSPAWQALASFSQSQSPPPLLRRHAFVAMITNRPAESSRYREERREAAEFFESLGYAVNSEDGEGTEGYFDYFSLCKYAFLPMVERNSTGQIIADCIVSSNFTTLPFSYHHKLWMRALPPFLTVSSVAELKEKIMILEADEELHLRLLEEAREFALPFMSVSTLETKEELVAGLVLAPLIEGERSRCDCLSAVGCDYVPREQLVGG